MGMGLFLFPSGGEVGRDTAPDRAVREGGERYRKKGNGFREVLFPAFRGIPVTVFESRAGVETLAGMAGDVTIAGEGFTPAQFR
jgi:hypothetical protein